MLDLQSSNPISQYLSDVQQVLGRISQPEIARVIDLLLEANRSQRQIFIMGNGGSAATASHFACDLGKGSIIDGAARFRVIALTDNVALMTAWANDTAYENIFAQQLAGLVRPGDIVVAISGSGNSPNVLNAMRLARWRGARTVGLTGFDGGQLGEMADFHLHVPSTSMEQVEDAHMVLTHLICTRLRALLKEHSPAQAATHWPFAANPLLQRLTEQVTRTVGVTVSSISILDERDESMVITAASPIRFLGTVPQIGRRVRLAYAPAHFRALYEEQEVLFRQHEARRAVPAHELEMTLTGSTRSGVLLPLRCGGQVTGVLSLGEMRNWERTPFTEKKLARCVELLDEWQTVLADAGRAELLQLKQEYAA